MWLSVNCSTVLQRTKGKRKRKQTTEETAKQREDEKKEGVNSCTTGQQQEQQQQGTRQPRFPRRVEDEKAAANVPEKC